MRARHKGFVWLAGAAALIAAGPAAAQTVVTAGAPGTTGQTALYVTTPGALATSDGTATAAELATFLGAPDDDYTGIGGQSVTYDLGSYRLIDGAGQDFNIYEVDGGVVEFTSADFLVSADGVTFFNVESTSAAALDLAGDESHGSASFRRSYDLGGAVTGLGASAFRYLRVQGTATGTIGGSNDFDLDGVGFANFLQLQSGGVPEPATWALMIMGFGAVGGAMRRRQGPVRAPAM